MLLLGFALGVRHATDADHVVAVSAIVSRTRRLGAAWLLGAVWGLGHSLTIFGVGALIIAGRLTIAPRLGLALEGFVGVVLVVLGLWNLAGRGGDGGVTAHEHDGAPAHLHLPEEGWLTRQLREAGPAQLLRSAGVGLAHGLAGSAAVALLVLAAIPEPRAGLLYLAVFGLGTMAGMLSISAAMEYSLVKLAARWTVGRLWLTRAAGLASLLFGLWVLRENAGVFAAHPVWAAR